MIGVHDREHQPRGDVLPEALELHHRGAALVAEDLVVIAVLVRAEAQVLELGRGEALRRASPPRTRAARASGCHTAARCSLRCSSRSAR